VPNVDENKELMGSLEVKRIHRIMLISNPDIKTKAKDIFAHTKHHPTQHSTLCLLTALGLINAQ